MKATRDSLLKVLRLHGPWVAVLLLCQCQMPSREAWQYIRSHGLLSYWSQPSPPFGAGAGTSQRYAHSQSSYQVPRYGSSRSTERSPQRSYAPLRTPYLAPSPSPSRSYAAPSPPPYRVEERVEPVRPAPRTKPRREPSAVARTPVEKPRTTPRVANDESSPTPTPAPSVAAKSNGTVSAPPKPENDLPYGTSVAGRPNMVNSPYAGKTQLVDVSGMTSGQTVKCPYTGKLFKVPASQQASNNAAPKLESKLDTPKMSSEPKAEEKEN